MTDTTTHTSLYQRALDVDPNIARLDEFVLSHLAHASLRLMSTPDGPVLGLNYKCDFKTEEEYGASHLASSVESSAEAGSFTAQLNPHRKVSEFTQEELAMLTADSLILSTRPIASVMDVSFTHALEESRARFSKQDTVKKRAGHIRVKQAQDEQADAVPEVPLGAGKPEQDESAKEPDVEPIDWAKTKVAELRVMLTELGGEPKRLPKAKLIEAIEEIRAARAADTSDSAAEEAPAAEEDASTDSEGSSDETQPVLSPDDAVGYVHSAWFSNGSMLVIPRGDGAFRVAVDALREALVAGTLLVVAGGSPTGSGLTFVDSRDYGEKTRESMLERVRWASEKTEELEPVKEALAKKGHSWFFLGNPTLTDGETKYFLNGRPRNGLEKQPFGWYTRDELLAEAFVTPVEAAGSEG